VYYVLWVCKSQNLRLQGSWNNNCFTFLFPGQPGCVATRSSSFLACNSRLRSAIRRHHPPQLPDRLKKHFWIFNGPWLVASNCVTTGAFDHLAYTLTADIIHCYLLCCSTAMSLTAELRCPDCRRRLRLWAARLNWAPSGGLSYPIHAQPLSHDACFRRCQVLGRSSISNSSRTC